MNRTFQLALAGAIIAVSCSAATAQTTRVRGTIAKADGNVLTLKSSDGAELKLTLTDNAMIVAVVRASMADIKEGTFLGSAPMPNSTMTNGSASGATVAGVQGSTMVVKYKDGEKKIVIPPDAPIVRYEIGGKDDLKAGAAFTVLAATRKPDGTFEASRINVGRDGVVPQ